VEQLGKTKRSPFGWIGLALGGVALLIVMVHFWGGPFEAQPNIGQRIGETAADIRQSAARALRGEPQPAPETQIWGIDRILQLSGPVLGAIAIFLGVVSLARREDRRVIAGSIGLGATAIGFQVFTWVVLLIAGVILLFGIMANLGSILGE